MLTESVFPLALEKPCPGDQQCRVRSKESILNRHFVSDMVWQWGQFLDHDLTLTPVNDEADPLISEFPPAIRFLIRRVQERQNPIGALLR